MGGGMSPRQWNDIVEVMKRKANVLDLPYLRQFAPSFGVSDILEQALSDAGI